MIFPATMKWVSFIPPTSRRTVIRAAQYDSDAVYLSGQTGSGKSAIARWIHANSPRSTKPFVTVADPRQLLEKIEAAGEGTLVLLDVDRYSTNERAEVARLVRSRSITDPAQPGLRQMVRARIIATATLPIDEFSVFDPVFKDFRIHVPSLSDRRAQLQDIAESLLTEMAHELRRDHVRELSPAVLSALRAHEWRANLRELRNILRYGILRTPGSRIELEHLPDLRDPNEILLLSREEFLVIERALRIRETSPSPDLA